MLEDKLWKVQGVGTVLSLWTDSSRAEQLGQIHQSQLQLHPFSWDVCREGFVGQPHSWVLHRAQGLGSEGRASSGLSPDLKSNFRSQPRGLKGVRTSKDLSHTMSSL